jgi:cardiolipin synthase
MDHFRKLLKKEQILTIPNFMSLFRIVLVPFIIWFYLHGQYRVAAVLVAISALTDILDGVVARRFHMVSDLGKLLDPISDKLTHIALLFCLLTRYPFIWALLVLLLAKELRTATLNAISIKRQGAVHSAKWYGKLCTVVVEGSMLLLILFPGIPEKYVLVISIICAAVMIFALVMYTIFYLRLILAKKPKSR